MPCLLTNPGLVLSALQSCTEPSCVLLCPVPHQTPAHSRGPERSSLLVLESSVHSERAVLLGREPWPCPAGSAVAGVQPPHQGVLGAVGTSSGVLLGGEVIQTLQRGT